MAVESQGKEGRREWSFHPTGHIRILRGSLAPDGAVAKITGKEGAAFAGRANVFDAAANTIAVDIDRAEMARRRKAWTAPPSKATRGRGIVQVHPDVAAGVRRVCYRRLTVFVTPSRPARR
ncbi:MAG TPA: dihydroxy-acid dehydratase [Desulfosarcina sp.]|nr:dihydroxy-acid dehydratase [Desulfosarcina sp.]